VPDTPNGESGVALQFGTDDLGVYARVCIDPSVFSQVSVLKTAYWFSDRFYLYLTRTTDGRFLVEFRQKNVDTTEDLTAACREFCTGLIDYAVRQHVLTETSAVRDALIRKAFFDVQNADADRMAQANESFVPKEGQSYRDDPLKIGQRRH
jgi:His-Xaa-Ser system protein HxsD